MKRRNNNKKLKIIVGIILFLIVLITTYIVLVITDILPNPLLDTSDLVCERKNDFGNVVEKRQYVFNFDNVAKLNSYQEIFNLVFHDYESAKEYYNSNKLSEKNIEFIEEEKTVKIIYNVNIEDVNHLKNKLKEDIKKMYTTTYNCECR